MRKLLLLALLTAIALAALRMGIVVNASTRLSLGFGFLLAAGYLSGQALVQIGIPRITGYLLAGLAFGPHGIAILDAPSLETLRPVEELALCLVAFAAGGELHFPVLRKTWKAVGAVTVVQLLGVFAAFVAAALVATAAGLAWVPGMSAPPTYPQALVLGLFSALVAYPTGLAGTMGVILSAGAAGPTSQLVLTATILKELVAILLVPMVLSAAQGLIGAGTGGHPFLFLLLSPAVGAAIGLGAATYFDHVRRHEMTFLLGLALGLVILSHSFHLEPMLVALAAGATTVSRSRRGEKILADLEGASTPVLVVFFTTAEAAIVPDRLASAWPLAIFLGIFRAAALVGSTWTIAKRFRLRPQRSFGAGFLAHAGLSLGLVGLLSRAWPQSAAFLEMWIPAVILAEVAGPIAFRILLESAGEIPAPSPRGRSSLAGGAVS